MIYIRCAIDTCWMNECNWGNWSIQEVWKNFTEEELIELRYEGKVRVNLEERGRSRTRIQAPWVWKGLISFINISPGPVTYLMLSKYFFNEMNEKVSEVEETTCAIARWGNLLISRKGERASVTRVQRAWMSSLVWLICVRSKEGRLWGHIFNWPKQM